MSRVITVTAGQSPRRLDVFVTAQSAHLSRATAQRWIEDGRITVNGRRAKPAQRVRPGDVVACHVPQREPRPVEPEPIPLDVLHEDPALLVIDKPPGLVMHPAPGHWTGTLLNALLHHLGRGDGNEPPAAASDQRVRPGLVHRLDKGTSGVVVIAKTDRAHRDLSAQFRRHSVHRIYRALVRGSLVRGGIIDQPLGRDTRDRRRVSSRSGRPRRAVTEFQVAEWLGPDATLVDLRPRTGRMHQIRAHLASIGHPVMGDRTYGGGVANVEVDRPLLHAAVLGFVHPVTGEYVEHRAPLPADIERELARRRTRPG